MQTNTVPFHPAASLPAVGIRFLTDFWSEKYLDEYILFGGSKIKFVTGRQGCGKTHFLRLMSEIAFSKNYRVVTFSAKEVWLHDFKLIYQEILQQCDLMECLKGCARKLITDMGFEPDSVPEGMTFIDYLSQENLCDALTKREIRTQLKTMFLDNPLLDNNFALACSMLTGSILGHPVLEEQNRALLLDWLHGEPSVKLANLRSIGLSPARITKYNARHMLRSLSEVIRLSGFSGLFITADDLEILVSRSSLEELHYTKTKREDTYESIRQLIDDIDSMHNIMFTFAFHRDLIDSENAGLKSYQALWMRIQNEICGERFNRFADIVDLDRMAAQEYTIQTLTDISEALLPLLKTALPANPVPITETQAKEILTQSRLSAIGIPQLILLTMTGGVTND